MRVRGSPGVDGISSFCTQGFRTPLLCGGRKQAKSLGFRLFVLLTVSGKTQTNISSRPCEDAHSSPCLPSRGGGMDRKWVERGGREKDLEFIVGDLLHVSHLNMSSNGILYILYFIDGETEPQKD